MKTNRAFITIHMLFILREKGHFTKQEIIDDLNVSRSSFFRAISEFRCYLQENRPWCELVFDEENETYRLVDSSLNH